MLSKRLHICARNHSPIDIFIFILCHVQSSHQNMYILYNNVKIYMHTYISWKSKNDMVLPFRPIAPTHQSQLRLRLTITTIIRPNVVWFEKRTWNKRKRKKKQETHRMRTFHWESNSQPSIHYVYVYVAYVTKCEKESERMREGFMVVCFLF